MFLNLSKKYTKVIARVVSRVISTGFGSGLSPKAPGTFGSLMILLICLSYLYCFKSPNLTERLVFSIFSIIIGIISCRIILLDYPEEKRDDPQEIVIDEFAGYLVSVSLIQWSFSSLLLGFILFRIFDISKIGPIKHAEKLPAEWGIMMDDVVAGIFAGLILFFCLLFFGAEILY
jgi:phosphatidylglycerophosphatase A